MVMGGCVKKGNITPNAEFNLFSDPESAGIVLKSGIDVYMVPLDIVSEMVFKSSQRALFIKLLAD